LAPLLYFVEAFEIGQAMQVACLSGIAFWHGHIDCERRFNLAEPLEKSGYGTNLIDFLFRCFSQVTGMKCAMPRIRPGGSS
jgi:hypothetical protein